MTPTFREGLHAKVARVLERAYSGELDLHSLELARHYSLGAAAGCGPQAVEYCIRAAESAATHCAWEEACSLWQDALKLCDSLPADAPQRAWRVTAGVYERLATTYGLMGDLERALKAARAAAERVPAEETVWLARLRRIQTLWLDAGGRRAQAETGLMEAEALLGSPSEQREAQWWQEWIDVQLSHCLSPLCDADVDQMQATAAEIAQAVEAHGTPLQRAQTRLVSWLIDIKKNRFASTDHTIALAQDVAAAYAEAGSPDLLFASEGVLAVTFLFHRERREEAGRHLVLHRELARETHECIHQARALWLQALWHRLHGDDDATRACALETLALLADRPIARWRGQALGDLSWVAWRRHDLATAAAMAGSGLSELEPLSPRCPYEWQVRWTLLAAALASGRPEIAVTHAAAMLDPSQQRLPGHVERLLVRTVAESREGRLQKETESTLIAAAREEGYL